MTEVVRELVHGAVLAMEIAAVLIILAGLMVGLGRFAVDGVRQVNRPEAYRRFDAYQRFKVWMGRTLLLGLEILVAADVVNTVALEPTLGNVLSLGLLVVIRTFLGWSLVLEIEGRWPWQARPDPTPISEL